MKIFDKMLINITEGEHNRDLTRKRIRFLKETQQDGSRSFFGRDWRSQMAIESDFIRKTKKETKGQI